MIQLVQRYSKDYDDDDDDEADADADADADNLEKREVDQDGT